MSQKKTFQVRITDSKPKICYPTVKERRREEVRLVKEASEIYKHWPKDAYLKWSKQPDKHLMCEVCGLMFSNLSNLRRHSKLHTEAKWQCPDCMKELGHRYDNFKRHLEETCPIMKIRRDAPKPTHPITIQAANQIILQASSTKKRQAKPWALTPIDLDIEPQKPKRRLRHRDNRITTAEIPLNAKVILVDPRKFCPVTPVTDQDAKMLEKMLEENTEDTEAHETGSEAKPKTPEPPNKVIKDIISMPSLETLFPEPEPTTLEDTANQPVETQVSETTEFAVTREILFSNITDRSLTEGFETTFRINEEQDDWLKDLVQPRPADNEDPWSVENYRPADRKIPLTTPVSDTAVTPQPSPKSVPVLEIHNPAPYPEDPAVPQYVYEEARKGMIPPWEFQKSLRSVMKTITHNDEQFLVLDDLEDADVRDEVNENNYAESNEDIDEINLDIGLEL